MANEENWEQKGERFNEVAKEAGEQKVMGARLVDKEIWGQRGDGCCLADVQAGRVKVQEVKPGKQRSMEMRR